MIKFVVSTLIIAVHLECGAAIQILEIVSGINKPSNCNCIETSLAVMPPDAKTCSQSNFIDGLSEKLTINYQRIQKELSKHTKCNCNFGNVEAALQKISAQIKKIIKIVSDCHSDEKMLNNAIDRYDELKKVYNSAVRQATASQSSECGSTLAKIRPILLNCAENIMAAVLKCLNFKRT